MAGTGTNLATAYITLVPTVQGIQGSIAEAFRPGESEVSAAGERAGGLFAGAAAGALVAAGAVAGVGESLKKLFDVGAVFDDMSDTIRAGTGQTGAALDSLNATAKSVATTVPTSFQSAADTVTSLSQRMGLSGDTLQTVSEQFLAAGNVLGQDVNVDAATKALNAFGVQGDQVSGQMDALFRVAQSTGVGMNDLTAAAAAQAPAMKELGFNFQDTVSLVGSLDKAGLNSTATMASMSKGLVKMAKDGEDPQQAFQRITGQLGDLVAQGNTAQAIDLASGIFGTKGATQFVGAIQSGTLSMDSLSAAAANTGDTILGVQSDTADAAESWQLLKNKALSALEPIGSAVFNLAGEGMSKLLDGFDKLTAKMDADVIPTAKQMWDVVAKGDFQGGGALQEDSPVVSFLLSIRETVQSTLGPLMDTLGQAWKQIGPPLTSAFQTIWNAVKPLIPTLLQLWSAFNPVSLLFKAILPLLPQIAGMLGGLAQVLADGVSRALQAVGPLLQTVVDVINRLIPFVTQLVASLLPPLMDLFNRLTPLIQAILDALIPLVDQIVNALIPVIEALMPIVERVFTFIADTIHNVITVFQGVIDIITGVLTGDWSKVWDGIKEIFGAVWDQIKNTLSTAWDVIVQLVTNLGPTVLGVIDTFFTWMVQKGQDFISWLGQGIQQAAGAVWDWFLGLPGFIWDRVVQAAGAITGFGGNVIGWVKDGIVNGATALWDWFTNLPSMIWEAIKNLGAALLGFGGQIIGWIIDGIKAAASKVADAVTGLFDLKMNDAGTGFVTANPWEPAAAGGGIVARAVGQLAVAAGGGYILPGYAPGNDTIPAMLSPGEAVMVPEFVSMIGPANVYALNRMARGGRSVNPNQILGTEMFADGGIVGGPKGLGYMIGSTLADRIKGGKTDGLFGSIVSHLIDSIKGAFTAGQVGGFNPSQDPSSFGWQRASNIQSFSWNGTPILGGVAGGTQSLWTALLNALVPQIPGGLNEAIYGYENRDNVNSPGTPSFHSYGLAVDINAGSNPNGAPGYGRSGNGVIPSGPAHSLAAQLGMLWGGDFSGTQDPMHFEIHVPPGAIGGLGSTSGGGGLFGKLASTYASKFAPAISAIVGGAGVERWRPTVLQALSLTGQPASLADVVLHQMMTESSGDPNAINLTDINAQRGDPSIGLLQVIGSTFRQYAMAPYNSNIRDPLSNIIAAIRYTIGRYGSVAAGMQGHAYDSGGWLMPGGVGINLRSQPEAVLTPAQSDALVAHASALTQGRTYHGGQHGGVNVENLYAYEPGAATAELDFALARCR